MEALATIVSSLAWPALLGAFVYYQQEPLRELLRALTAALKNARGLKVEAAGVSIELAEIKSATAESVNAVTTLPYAGEPAIFQYSDRPFIEALIAGERVEAVTFDLGRGTSFLTSRLFIAVATMARQRGVKVVAFVRDTATAKGQYVGCAICDDVLAALAAEYPEYEAALGMSLDFGWWRSQPGPTWPGFGDGPWKVRFDQVPVEPLGPNRVLPEAAAAKVVGQFIFALQQPTTPALPEGWTRLPTYDERAAWVTPAWLLDALGTALRTETVEQGGDTQAAVKVVLRARGTHVGLVDGDGALVELVSRQGVVEQVARVKGDLAGPPTQTA